MALSSYTTRGKGYGRCDRRSFAKRLREVRELGLPEKDLRPLHKHLLNLARQSFSVGACKRAGREVLMAKRLVQKYPAGGR